VLITGPRQTPTFLRQHGHALDKKQHLHCDRSRRPGGDQGHNGQPDVPDQTSTPSSETTCPGWDCAD